jgi:hypothetical protein
LGPKFGLKKIVQTEIAEVKFLRFVSGYTRKDQIRYAKIREKLNILNLNNKTVKFI